MSADFNSDKYRLSEAENQRIFDEEIKPKLFADKKLQAHPVAVIFGGQPGAGKSMSVNAAVSELAENGGCVKIDGDALRQFHPRYDLLMTLDDKTAAVYTGGDAGSWVEKAISETKRQRVHVVIEGTMRSAEVAARTMSNFRDAGYTIDARALAVSFQMSQLGIFSGMKDKRLTGVRGV